MHEQGRSEKTGHTCFNGNEEEGVDLSLRHLGTSGLEDLPFVRGETVDSVR